MAQPDTELFRQLSEQYSLIRVKGKIPIEKEWQNYCHQKRTFEEIGFLPGENAGIACGPASGVLVVDVDDPVLFEKISNKRHWDMPITRCHETGSGKFHFLYKYPAERIYNNKSCQSLGFDVRGVGGQVVAPGSIHPDTGLLYSVAHNGPVAEAPKWLIDLYSTEPADWAGPRVDPVVILGGVGKGQRDEDLFSYACQLRRKEVTLQEAQFLVCHAARNCDPPFPQKEALKKVEQAWKRYGPVTNETYVIDEPGVTADTNRGLSNGNGGLTECNQEADFCNQDVTRPLKNVTSDVTSDNDSQIWLPDPSQKVNLTDAVKVWLETCDGIFTIRDLAQELRVTVGSKEYNAIKLILKRLKDNFTICQANATRGTYRKREDDTTEVDPFANERADEFNIDLPLDLSEMCKLYSKSIFVFAGTKDSGKTALALNVAKMNAAKQEVHYFYSEMGLDELRSRLEVFGDMDHKKWKQVHFHPVKQNFHDHILRYPDALSIVDYLQMPDDAWKIGGKINEIYEVLARGACLICLQKRTHSEFAAGGEVTADKARLYVSLDRKFDAAIPYTQAKILSAKIPRLYGEDHKGKIRNFRLDWGWRIFPLMSWEYAPEEEPKKKPRRY
jgi:hypothetical protein